MEFMLYAMVIHYYRHHGPNQNWHAPRFYTEKGPEKSLLITIEEEK